MQPSLAHYNTHYVTISSPLQTPFLTRFVRKTPILARRDFQGDDTRRSGASRHAARGYVPGDAASALARLRAGRQPRRS